MLLNTRLAGCLLAAGLLLPGLAGAEQLQAEYSAELTLSELVERVYQRLPGKLGESKYSGQQQANDSVAGAMFAEPATANLSHFNDAIGSSDGFQEWEGSVDLPLWLPGQKQQQQGLSAKIAAQLPAYQQQLKLQAAGEVRTLIWQIKLAEADLQQATLAWKTAQKLEQDVVTRVKAGDLPVTERLFVSSNTIEAHSKMVDADSRLQQTMKTYVFITGEQVLPEQHRGHWLMNIDLTILSLFGIFGLSGIVVNDSIILITFFKHLRESGIDTTQAIIEAATQRLRAVLLTSLTTIGGLTPLLFETSQQAQFLIPMAVSISFGLMFATVLVLLVIPAMLSVHESAVDRINGRGVRFAQEG